MKMFKILTTVFFAVLASTAFAQSIAPLTFCQPDDEDCDSSNDADNWDYLMNFKLWGSEGISFGNRPLFYDSRYYDYITNTKNYTGVDLLSLGWVGTATGNLESHGYSGYIDGPIIVGGDITNDESELPIEIVTGPIRSKGTIEASVGHDVVRCASTAHSESCSYDKVPEIRPNLRVPVLSGVELSDYGSLNVSGRTVLNVDSYCSGSGICDIFFNTINFANDSRLVVLMADGGRPTRIFVNKLNFGIHPEIVVNYGDGDLTMNEYDGSLLIYAEKDIVFENMDEWVIMGTFVSSGTIELESNIAFAGQMIANNLIVGNEIRGDGLNFAPFKGAGNALSFLGNKANRFKESDSWQTISLGLSNAAEEKVTFDYCFEFNSESETDGTYADYLDVGESDSKHDFPICNKDQSKSVTIPVGEKNASGIYIKPLVDGLVENDESLWLKISNLQGTTLAYNYESGHGYKIYIVSDDVLPSVSSELVINVNEDSKHTFTSSEFKFKHPTQDFQSVIITSLPAKGSLLLNNKAVSKDQEIAVANLGKLTYQAAANDFGNKYTTFKYKVVGDGTGDNTSIEYTATVHVIPVNDKPSVSDVVFSVSEIDHEVSGGPITVTDVANERDVDTYTYILVNESNSDYAAFNQLFEIVKLSNQNATIKVKSGAEFDYNNKSQYVVYANIKDDAATETQTVNGPQSTGLFKITVKIVDENHTPSIEDQAFSIAEKSSDGSDWSSGKTIGGVKASDSDDDALTYSVTTANVPFAFKKGTNWLVVSDGSMLDYETKPSWTFTVSVSDGVLSAEADITVNLTDENESPTYEKTEYVFTIHEHASKGELVGSVVAGDEDTWSVLGYEILDYVEGSGDASIFNIDKKGDIYLSSSSLNYEMQKTYQILAKATDNGKTYGAKNERIDFKDLSATTLVTIEIIDDPDNPEIIDDEMKGYDVEENTIDQNSPTGMEIACLEVKDEDAGQVATLVPYVTDNGDTDAERLFDAKIKKDGSKYKLCLIVKDDSRLDYESIAHIHSVDIGVKDDDELTAKVTKTINLVDVNEKPIISDFTTFSFYENKGDDYPIGRLYSDDVDTSKAFTQNVFTVVGGDADLFSITENGYILTKRNFDYDAEKRHAYELEISLSDNNPEMYPKLTTSATISIMLKNMPEAPIITSTEFSVKEKSEAGELIGVIEAVDPDGDDVLAFSLYDESPYVTVSSDGEIRVREGADVDYDKMHDFIIMVTVKDKDGLESESAIAIKVIDIKDESSSSSQKSKSSSSSEEREDESSSSSRNGVVSSSSSSGKTVASSSSQKSKSSSSGAEREGESSSSSRNDKKSSSSSRISDDDNMDFYIKMTGTFEFEIVLGETLPAIAKQYAVLDMKGQVLSVGELSDKSARVKVPTAGAYIVKIGLGYRRVNVR